MKNILQVSAIALLALFTFSSCCKEENGKKTYFYFKAPASGKHLKLYVEGQYKGDLPNINTSNTCNNDSIPCRALAVFVTDKCYNVEARTCQGETVASGHVTMYKHSITGTKASGQMGVAITPDYAIVYLGGCNCAGTTTSSGGSSSQY